ncbi:MAG: GTPase HflX [Dehalococcoidia bacterium]|nr:MAG: GTPase HflX [Dehalococcoidia bacterium]
MAKTTYSTKTAQEKAFLVGVDTGSRDGWTEEESLEELAQLAKTAGSQVAGQMTQKLDYPNRFSYLGKGKLDELILKRQTANWDVIIFDDELSPRQQNELEQALKIKIIDRVALILDIFARHARTHEGKLQVELAQHQYLLPRLAGQWSHLERLGGGIGTRGPGESQLETDKRLIRTKISKLKKELEEVRKHRTLYREKRRRSGIPIVALVGYTNTGKSTLLNALSQANVLVENKLFATLDPTTKRLTLPDMSTVLLTDTVGFIRKLPPTLVEAFRATLEELSEATVLLHVVDLTSHNAAEQSQVVEGILRDLGLEAKPRITALNKIDLLLDKNESWDETKALEYLNHLAGDNPNTVLISAGKKWGLKKLLETLNKVVNEQTASCLWQSIQNEPL